MAIKLFCLAAAIIVIFLALLVTVARLSIPYLNKHITKIEAYVAQAVGQPVHVGHINVWWQGQGPMIQLDDVELGKHIKSNSLHLNIDLLSSLYHRTLKVRNIVLTGGNFAIKQLPNHRYLVNGLKLGGHSARQPSFLQQMFSFSDIAVHQANLSYQALGRKRYAVHIDYLNLNNRAAHHKLSGRLAFTAPFKLPVLFSANITGSGASLGGLSGELYVKTADVRLRDMLPAHFLHAHHLQSGVTNGQLWLDWRKRQVQRVQSQFKLLHLQVKCKQRILLVPKLSANIAWLRQKKGWLFLANKIAVTINHHQWPEDAMYLASQPNQLKVGVRYVSVDDLRALLRGTAILSVKQNVWLKRLQPSGVLRHITFQHDGPVWRPKTISLRVDLAKVSIKHYRNFPAFQGLSGQLYWRKGVGQFFVDGKPFVFDDTHLFEKPMHFDRVYLNVGVRWLKPSSLVLRINNLYLNNQALHASVKGFLRFNPKGNTPPYLSFLSRIKLADTSQFYAYLPSRMINPGARFWLKHAFKGGSFHANVLFRGRVDHFPFDQTVASFLVDMHLKNFHLHYSPEWPELYSKNTHIQFVGDKLTVFSPVLTLRHVIAKNVSAEIPALLARNPNLLLKLTGTGGLRNMIDVIAHSSLPKNLSSNLNALNPKGLATLAMQVFIPLNYANNSTVYGKLHFHNASFSIMNVPKSVQKVNGELDFNQNMLKAAAIKAIVFGHPAVLAANTVHQNSGLDVLNVHAKGYVDAAYLAAESHLPINKFAAGTFPFNVYIARSLNAKHDKGAVTVQVKSYLNGLILGLPDGLAKTADQKRLLNLQFHYYGKRFSNIKGAYGGLANFDLDVIDFPHLGKPHVPGYSVSLALKHFDWPVWQAFFKRQGLWVASSSLGKNALAQYHNQLVNLNLHIDHFSAYQQTLNNLNFVLQPAPKAWHLQIKGHAIAGNILWSLANKSIVANFSRLNLQAYHASAEKQPAQKSKKTFNFFQLPSVNLSVAQFSYKDLSLNHLVLNFVATPRRVTLSKLSVSGGLLTAGLTGVCSKHLHQIATHLAGHVSSQNVALLLKDLGLTVSKSVHLTSAETRFNLNWLGVPYAPDLHSMQGNFFVSLGPGNISDLGKNTDNQLGLGRLLNALSVESILQKLTFNFNRYKNGYNFMLMHGHFNIAQGSLKTKDALFDGAVASVQFSGKVGLLKKDFDLLLTVKPHVTGSVPVVTALLVNPAAGLFAWLADLFFSPAVSQAASQQLALTGHWDYPKISPFHQKVSS